MSAPSSNLKSLALATELQPSSSSPVCSIFSSTLPASKPYCLRPRQCFQLQPPLFSGSHLTLTSCSRLPPPLDHTYYVIDMVCWRGYSLYDCTAEFRFFWLSSKLTETGACDPPSAYHKYRFSLVPVYNCDQDGLQMSYSGGVPFVRDGMLFYNKHAHYQSGNTPLALVWKDNNCSQYVFDTDGNGHVPFHQQVVLELQAGGSLASSDDPPVVFGHLDEEFVKKSDLMAGSLLRFSVTEGGFIFLDGKLQKADLQYLGKANKARSFADTYSKVLFQHMVRHSALTVRDLLSAVSDKETSDLDMVG